MFDESHFHKEVEAIYLGLLTARDIKPLSRLEYLVNDDVLALLEELGLTIASVVRIAQNGIMVQHFVFSKHQNLIDAYLNEFDGVVLKGETPSVIRSEGRYFGYPVCCVEAYIRRQWVSNGLARDDQHSLFHFACPGCKKTPLLLPHYRVALGDAKRLSRKLHHVRAQRK